MGQFVVRFGPAAGDALLAANFSLVLNGTLIAPGAWSWVSYGAPSPRGQYLVTVPGVATEGGRYDIWHTASGVPWKQGDIPATPAEIAEAVRDAGGTGNGTGTGEILFTWHEYESGHNNDPNYAVEGVTVAAYANDVASGSPEGRGVTDEAGVVDFYLDAGTYFLFRRKAGRKFTNPVTIEVNWGGNPDSTPQAPGELVYTHTEYETGHVGDPNYVVPNVWIRIYNNRRAAGVPLKVLKTGADGSVAFALVPGTYYLYRFKSGYSFANPFQIEVS